MKIITNPNISTNASINKNISRKICFALILAILMNLFLIPGIALLTNPAHAAISQVKINCVGDSITTGVGTSPGFPSYPNSYPLRLQLLLGTGTKVGNYGASGYTLMSKCDYPYILSGSYNISKNSSDIVIIMLGTNDAKIVFETPGFTGATVPNWDNKADFIPDYVNLINIYKNLASHPQVFICTTCPVTEYSSIHKISPDVVNNELQPMIYQVAEQTGVTVIDVYSAMLGHEDLYIDKLHPNNEGAQIIANTVYAAIKDAVDAIYATKNPTPTAIATPTPTPTPTPTTTSTSAPTATATPTPTATPTVTPSPMPTLTQTQIPSSSFTDMSDFEWAKESVDRLAFLGIVKGISNDKFAPGNMVTRSEFAAFMVRALNLTDETASCEFTDVKNTDWFYSDVSSAKKAGIITGRPSEKTGETGKFEFAPDENITREDIAVICANAIKNNLGIFYDYDINTALSLFIDRSEISDYAIDSAAICVVSGLIKGVTADAFAPKSHAIRAEAAVIIDRIMSIK